MYCLSICLNEALGYAPLSLVMTYSKACTDFSQGVAFPPLALA